MKYRKMIIGIALIVVILAAIWYFKAQLIAALPSADSGLGVATTQILIAVFAGFLGAIVASLLRPKNTHAIDELERRVMKLERQRHVGPTEQPVRQSPPTPSTSNLAQPPRPLSKPNVDDLEPPVSPFTPRVTEPEVRAAVLDLKPILAGYNRAASGSISRSKFNDFFESVGRSGPVEIADGGRTINQTSKPESFLTSVHAGEQILVFPSYEFVANQPTQFNTIAGVPEAVAAIFDLSRGDGEILMEMPAVYRETPNGLELVTKGRIRGFGG